MELPSRQLGHGGRGTEGRILGFLSSTRPRSFNVIVDTGSADLIVGATSCTTCKNSGPLWDNTASSTSVNISTASTSITFGSGSAKGFKFTDTISLGPYSQPRTTFLPLTEVSEGLIPSPVSGILGLAFGSISVTGGTPFWQSIVTSGQATTPVVAFWLSRFIGSGSKEQTGGSFTLGGTNSSLYSGEIEFLPLTGTANSFWSLDVSSITAQGKAVTLSATKTAAVDTGTTVIAGPSADVKAIWAAIPGSALDTVSGFYQFPCATSVTVTISFGGRSWPINSADLNLGTTSSGQCIGGIIPLQTATGTGSPAWIIGTTFLKNVYSVFRQNPAAIGFAQLSTLAGGAGTPNDSTQGPSSAGAPSLTGTADGSGPTTTGDGTPNSPPSSHGKSKVGPIVGGVIGGLALIGFAILALLLYRRRRQRNSNIHSEEPAAIPTAATRTPLSFVVDDPEKAAEPSTTSHPSSPPPLRSISTMKREQNAAVHHYGDAHTTPDVLLRTQKGLYLLPGSASRPDARRSGASSSTSTPPPLATQSEQETSAAQTSQTEERLKSSSPLSARPPGAASPDFPSAAGATDPAILEELQSLRDEVRRLAAQQEGSSAPPSYDNH
ncbi:aspartic peptidase domain-containing protein [Mycena crocata]|nr:aspartic peptidase domain-containing protein [Mycena crocata]